MPAHDREKLALLAAKRKKMRLLDLPPDSPMLLPSPQRARLKGDSASGPGYTGVYDLLLLTMIGLSAVLYVSAIHFEVVQVSAEAQAMLAQLAALWIGMMFSLAGIFFLKILVLYVYIYISCV